MWSDGRVSLPAAAAPAVAAFERAIAAEVALTGLYAGGSLASGDYVPGISDLDLVAIIAAPLDTAKRQRVGEVHGGLMRPTWD
jgi:predicted nucleotidyltransferase